MDTITEVPVKQTERVQDTLLSQKKSKKVKIRVYNKDFAAGTSIWVGANGVPYEITEGEEVVVPEIVYSILMDAVIETPVPGEVKAGQERKYTKTPRYIVEVLGWQKRGPGRVENFPTEDPNIDEKKPTFTMSDEGINDITPDL